MFYSRLSASLTNPFSSKLIPLTAVVLWRNFNTANVWRNSLGSLHQILQCNSDVASVGFTTLPSFDTVIHNYRKSFLCVWSRPKHSNDLVKLLRRVSPSAFLWVLLCTSSIAFFFLLLILSICLCVCLLFVCLWVVLYLIQIKWWYSFWLPSPSNWHF